VNVVLHSEFGIRNSEFVDANRDGEIKFDDDSDKTTPEKPFRFWCNEDNDSGEIGGDDKPSSDPDWNNEQVDGIRDLVDFFPVRIDVKGIDPTTAEIKLRHANNALSFVYASELDPSNSREHLTDLDKAEALKSAQTIQILSSGVPLKSEFLQQIKQGKGVILVEGRAPTTSPLVVEVWVNQQKITEAQVELSTSPVENMFRYRNLLSVAGGNPDDGPANRLGEPPNYPDQSDKKFVWVHGYNVSGQEAREWHAEMFKRFYWSGSKARFYGVSWYGYQTSFAHWIPPDYHQNVMNAFTTAPAMKDFINTLGGNVTVAAHSLGNMVVGSMVHDHDVNIQNYFPIDAAVARESYDGQTQQSEHMINGAWKGFTDYRNLWASEWHTLFKYTPDDKRNTLTWRNRLSKVGVSGPTVYNFYSSTEDLLQEYPGDSLPDTIDWNDPINATGRFGFCMQEKFKGDARTIGIGGAGSIYGGWGFNTSPDLPAIYRSPADISQHPELLETQPFFDPGYESQFDGSKQVHGPDWIVDLFDPAKGSTTAEQHREQLLAQALPALTLPAGANFVSKFGDANNFDMDQLFKTNAQRWPRGPNSQGLREWRHSDIRAMPYNHIYQAFDKMVNLGGLDQ